MLHRSENATNGAEKHESLPSWIVALISTDLLRSFPVCRRAMIYYSCREAEGKSWSLTAQIALFLNRAALDYAALADEISDPS